MSRFYIASSSPSPTPSAQSPASNTSDDSDDDLPYPAPLSRSAFLSPAFSPQAYLSTLHNRHQTLEDLRAELRSRSQLLSRELLDLVNANYTDFLSLGASLKGGDERVEEVRVGLLGFRKEVEGMRRVVREREAEVARLVAERESVRRRIDVGRRVLGFENALRGLEEGLVVEAPDAHDADSSDGEEDDEDDALGGVSVAKLRRHVLQYCVVREAEKSLDGHPFVVAQAPRLVKVRNTLLLDLSMALQTARRAEAPESVIKVMKLYADMDEAEEAVKVLKGSKA